MWKSWIQINATEAAMITLSAVVIYAGIILFIRLAGLRSFSKMSAFDFAMTIAVGSLFGSAISSKDPTILAALLSLALLFLLQNLIAAARRRLNLNTLTDNNPVYLFKDGQIQQAAMRKAGVTTNDLRGKLREANVLSLDHVHAVIFETTGDVSVLHGDPDRTPDPFLLEDVKHLT